MEVSELFSKLIELINIKAISKPRKADLSAYYPKHEYKHEKTNRLAKFYGDTELRMGFSVSKLAIYENEKDITEEHLISENYFQTIPKCYNPWSYDGEILVLTTVKEGNLGSEIQFYSLAEKKVVYSEIGDSIAILCAPASPYVLMTEYDQKTHTSRPFIVDMKGERIKDIPIRSVPINLFIDWITEDMKFIAITNDPQEAGNIWLYYGDGKTGEIIDKIPLNPQKIINKEDIRKISFDSEDMIFSTMEREFEVFKEWENIQFNRKKNILTLTYAQTIEGKFDSDTFGTVTKVVAVERDYKIEIKTGN